MSSREIKFGTHLHWAENDYNLCAHDAMAIARGDGGVWSVILLRVAGAAIYNRRIMHVTLGKGSAWHVVGDCPP